MKQPNLRYVIEDIDRHGNVRVYVRQPGKRKIRIKERPGTPEFLAAYLRALESDGNPATPKAAKILQRPPESLGWLCQQYFRSAEYKQLSASTRKVRRQILDRFCEQDGAKPYALLEPRHLRSRRDHMADRPEAANSLIKALRQVFNWAMQKGVDLATSNPARDVPYLKPKNPDGYHTWTISEVEQFEARHPIGTKPRLALALLLFTGVRRSDVVHLGRQMDKAGFLIFTEAKGRENKPKHREIKITTALQEVIDATPSGHLTFLVTEFGKPFTRGGFGNWFRDRCNEAGLQGCSAHGLRKAGATILANRGATEHELMALYGWTSSKQALLYTRQANRRRLAARAADMLSDGRDENENVPPKPTQKRQWD